MNNKMNLIGASFTPHSDGKPISAHLLLSLFGLSAAESHDLFARSDCQ